MLGAEFEKCKKAAGLRAGQQTPLARGAACLGRGVLPLLHLTLFNLYGVQLSDAQGHRTAR